MKSLNIYVYGSQTKTGLNYIPKKILKNKKCDYFKVLSEETENTIKEKQP